MRNRSLMLLLASVAWAQPPTSPAAEKPATVEGVVTNAITGDPIPRAHVTLSGMVKAATNMEYKTYGVLSKPDGTFSMPGLPAGTFTLNAECEGYAVLNRFGFGSSGSVRVAAGDTKTGVTVKLSPNGVITGRVLDADGEPVEGVNVMAQGITGAFSITDDQGQFRLGGLAPGKYTVSATPRSNNNYPPEIRTDGTTESHYSPTWFPSSLDVKGAQRVEVTAGSETSGIEVRLVRTPIVAIRGKVIGMPAGTRNARVQVRRDNSFGQGTQLKPDGSFEVWRVDPGKQQVTAMWFGDGSPSQTSSVEVDVAGENINGIQLRYTPPFDIPGTLQFDDEQAKPPQPKAQSAGAQNPQQNMIGGGPRIRFQAVDFNGMSRPPQPADVAPDGSFTLHQVSPNRYRIGVTWQPTYIKSMRFGDTSIEGEVLDLTNVTSGAPLTVVLSSAMAQITGTITDSNGPAPGVQIVLLTPSMERYPNFTMSGQDGTYTFKNIPPGNYRIGIAAPEQLSAIMSRRASADELEGLEPIEIHASDKITKDLKK
jgi:hypothetical protein